jgi:hypothetical protein
MISEVFDKNGRAIDRGKEIAAFTTEPHLCLECLGRHANEFNNGFCSSRCKANYEAKAKPQTKPQSALDFQEAGSHYKTCKIQPIEYMYANGLNYPEGAIVKYITRHRNKGGAEDIRKIKHFCDLILELEYGNQPDITNKSRLENAASNIKDGTTFGDNQCSYIR